ncbi:hypothetical protein HJ01_02809 [Flavobacterium frigoris PS1]|uniref:Uncharacterized protein n=1 Tax=Flavobacterium frigoris (strain PS1) TaxID=1086011 RepID=H7FUJ4_FLAFP|nr:hypothetical protein HJ01_02809 [Flavobacterium frigoris PS1]
MIQIKIYAGIAVLILFFGISLFSKDPIKSELMVAFSIIIGILIYKQLSNQKNIQK